MEGKLKKIARSRI